MELAVRSSSASLVPTQRLNRYLREIRLTRLFGKLRGELYTLLWEYAEREATKNEKVRLLLLPVVRVHGLGLERHRSYKSWLRRAVAATQIRFSEQRRSFQELSARKSAVGPREIPFAVGKARVNNVRRDASKLGKVFLGARPRRSRKLASRRRTTLFGPFLDACIPGIHRRKRRRYRRLPSSDCVARGPRKHGLECKQASRRWCCCAVSFILTRIFPFCFVCEQCCVSVAAVRRSLMSAREAKPKWVEQLSGLFGGKCRWRRESLPCRAAAGDVHQTGRPYPPSPGKTNGCDPGGG